MDKLDKRAEECKFGIGDGIAKKKQVFMGGKIGGQSKTFRDEITENISKVKGLRDEKKAVIDKLNVIKEKMRELDAQK